MLFATILAAELKCAPHLKMGAWSEPWIEGMKNIYSNQFQISLTLETGTT